MSIYKTGGIGQSLSDNLRSRININSAVTERRNERDANKIKDNIGKEDTEVKDPAVKDPDKVGETEPDKNKTLEAFKKEIYKYLEDIKIDSSKDDMNISVDIPDSALKKMMEDPTYKKKMLDNIKRDMESKKSDTDDSIYALYSIDKNGEYKSISWGSELGNVYDSLTKNSLFTIKAKKEAVPKDEENGLAGWRLRQYENDKIELENRLELDKLKLKIKNESSY